MSEILNQLIEMGFSKERAELAIKESGGNDIEAATDWILSHPEPEQTTNAVIVSQGDDSHIPAAPAVEEVEEAKSIKCEDCGKLFTSENEVQFHAAKSGHSNFSESREEKKVLTDEEKKEQLAKIEAKLRQRRLDREAREKQEQLEKEKSRIRSGKDMLEAKRKQEDIEMKKIIDQRKREKQEERLARERVKQQIEQDKLARKAKHRGETPAECPAAPSTATSTVSKPVSSPNYTEVKLQIRMPNGATITQSFGAKEPLSAVRLYVQVNRGLDEGPFILMTPFPRKEFVGDDYDKPLDLLGLAPSAVLVLKNSISH